MINWLNNISFYLHSIKKKATIYVIQILSNFINQKHLMIFEQDDIASFYRICL